MSKSFDVIGMMPADLAHPGLSLAAARAGGIGILDLEFALDEELSAKNFERLLAGTPARVGLRVTAARAAFARRLLQAAGDRMLVVILAGAASQLRKLRDDAGVRSGDVALGEILSAADVADAEKACDGLVARGHEAGGWVGEDTSYILLQKLRGRVTKPLYVQGGVGVRAAAACRSAGAAGVVLDDTLLLMAESPLPAALQVELGRLNGAECKLFGELLGLPCRVYSRPATAALKASEEDSRSADGGMLEPQAWAKAMGARLGWVGDGTRLLPLGQGIGLASGYRETYRSVGRLVQAVRRQSLRQCDRAAELGFLDENGPLAKSHGTRFPLVQGPMTRVSDSPAFAAEVAKGGGLPILALALMRGPQVAEMLRDTKAKAGQLPWGVGLLGFIPHALREEQCAEIWKCKPPFALIAGGRPDQAAEFEKRGIATYIHAPAPALLKMYLDQGARRFVFEGRECGGHVGPLASFPLWEQMIEVLLTHVPSGEEKNVHVLFAGGIHDATSGAMVASMAAPLAERGMKVGALMGTAYLFTNEIVSSGAVVDGFQREALRCERTMNLESGPGHATRCVDTKFAHDFYDTRRRLIREGKSSEEIREALEDLNLGRLRIASKGLDRDAAGKIVVVPEDRQIADGMYMIGQVATLRRETIAVEALHRDVTRGAQKLLERQVGERVTRADEARPSDIAIVGIGITLPKANDGDDYWQLIVDRASIIREVPEDRWDPALLFDPNQKARDKIYSKWGGFLDDVPFDPLKYGIPPKSMKSIDPLQLLTLETAARTLADAGYADGQFDRENTSVILGAGGGAGDLGVQYSMRAEMPRFVENLSPDVFERLPEWTEESFAGTLLNVAAGRVANRLDFGGVNFTVDAACGSSLAAISIAVHELETGRSAMVLAGGFDTTQSAFAFTAFAKTQALSPQGKPRTFDQAADGIAISEGVAMIALKRLADAERDGDRIYAVIKSTAGSSDGKALGLTAPRMEGQVRALKRAYAKAGFGPATLGMVEAHGTGTPVGDRTEAQTISKALTDGKARPKTVALGSVKTVIGHTKAAAGVSGLVKVALSLYHRTLPAHVGVEKPIDTVADPNAPVYLLKDARPWIAHPDHPRRGGVSAFGFGGTNFHAVLEEYRGGASSAGSNRWPSELYLFRASDATALVRDLEKVLPAVQPGSRVKPGELAFALARQAEARRGQPVGLAIVSANLTALAADIGIAVAHLKGEAKTLPPHIRLNRTLPQTSPNVAFLFPGQGAQYVNMGREAALYFDEVREALEFADRTLLAEFPELLSTRILPVAAFDQDAEAAQLTALTDTRVAQPAIGALALGYLRLAERLDITPMATAGHSYGEYAALMAAGVVAPDDFLKLSAVRGRAMADASKSSVPGGMAAAQGRRERVTALISDFPGVRVANHNAPEQSVISGPKDAVARAVQKLADEGVRATLLPVSGAFHTELVAPAKTPLSDAIHATEFSSARVQVYSNTTGGAYPAKPAEMQTLLDGHMLASVEFVTEIEAMYAAGARVFLELGPKGICSGMAKQTLAGRDSVVATSLDASGGGMRGLMLGLAELFAAGVAFDAAALFAGRDLALVDLGSLEKLGKPQEIPKHWWMVSGGAARPVDDPVRRTGLKPPLTKATGDAARAAFAKALEADIRSKMPPPEPVIVHVPAPAPAPAAPSPVMAAPVVASGLASEAIVAYQQTMRQFLSLQERVVQQFLGGVAGAPMAMPPTMPAQAPIAAPMPGPVAAPVAAASIAPAPVAASVPAAAPVAEKPSSAPAAAASPAGPATKAADPAFAKPAAAPDAPAPAVLDVKALLLGIVSERTGYPSEMLGLDADLEAELGIDSIKRVEILGALRKALPSTMDAGLSGRMEKLTKAKSLNAILAEVGALVPASPVAAPVAASASAPAAVSAAPAAEIAPAVDFHDLLIGIVSERTGYPAEMLGLDADLEADLGIDSIKRVEILGAFQKRLPATLASAVQSKMERFTKSRSLTAILAVAKALAPAGAAPAALPAAPVAAATQAAPAVAPVAAAAAPDFRALLLGVVSERTGYPTEMLGLEADLEADLGIDSIKRVEILGAFQKALPADLSPAVQGRMERLTKARSLDAILGELKVLAPGAAPAAASAAPASAAPGAPVPVTGVKELLIGIVSERTGYPAEMLGLEADLEADLGIDSIKRVEILGAFQKSLPEALAAAVQSRMERFTKARSLSAILAQFDAAQAPAAPAAAPAAAAPAASPEPSKPAASPAKAAAEETPLPRFVIKTRPAPLSAGSVLPTGLALVLGPKGVIVDGVTSELVSRGLTPVVVHDIEPGALRAAIAAARAQHGAVRTFLHLHGLASAQAGDLAAWRSLYHRDLLTLFHGLQCCVEDLDAARVVAASRLGGTFGRDAVGRGGPVAGGVNGILNCVRYEYPQCQARAVDFDGQSDAEVVRLLVTELLSIDTEKEAGYIGLERYGASTVNEPLAASPFPSQVTPSGDWVLLATGGARGITAEIIEELVRPGMRVVLLGRTAEPGPEDKATVAFADAAALKKGLLQAKIARGEKPKPVDIDREVSRVLTDREIRANVAKLRTAGATVEYRACDVRDEAALSALLDELYTRFGRIDAVIHGAGVIEDKLLADKSADSFERVLSTKLDAAFVLSRRLRPESLRLLSFFTSVAGRYGNRGQSDYAAANEVLNRLAWELHRAWPQTRVVAVNWGPWDGGMASEGIKKALRERGMEPIPVPAGRRFFVDELARGPRNEVELVAGEGPWAQLGAPVAEPVSASTGFAFVRRAPLIGLGGAVTLEHRLTLTDDPYLGDHVVDGKPVLPMAAAIEYMAQFVACGWPEWQVAELRDLRAFAGVVIDGDHGSDVVLRAKSATHSEAGSQAVTVEIADPRRRSGPNFRATAILLPELPAPPPASLGRLPTSQVLEGSSAYARYLSHGERFRSLLRVHGVHSSGTDAEVMNSTPRTFLGERGRGSWLFDPALMDALPQLSFIWAQLNRRKGSLPTRYGRIRRFGSSPLAGPLTVLQRIRPLDAEDTLLYEAEFVDAAGRVRIAISDGESAMSTSLNRLAPSSPDFAGLGSGKKT